MYACMLVTCNACSRRNRLAEIPYPLNVNCVFTCAVCLSDMATGGLPSLDSVDLSLLGRGRATTAGQSQAHRNVAVSKVRSRAKFLI